MRLMQELSLGSIALVILISFRLSPVMTTFPRIFGTNYMTSFLIANCLVCSNSKSNPVTKKGSSSITKFCHSLKNLADALVDCDSNIDKVELVMQILRQLPPSYHIIVDVITNRKLFPSFLKAKNMLLIHESHEENTKPLGDLPITSITALYSSNRSYGKSKNKYNLGKNNQFSCSYTSQKMERQNVLFLVLKIFSIHLSFKPLSVLIFGLKFFN